MIIGWTLVMVAALGLAWFAGMVVLPAYRTRQVVLACDKSWLSREEIERRLGGSAQAVACLEAYLHRPEWAAPKKTIALRLLRDCGTPALHALVRCSGLKREALRKAAVEFVTSSAGKEDRQAETLAALAGGLKHVNPEVRVQSVRLMGWSAHRTDAFATEVALLLDDPEMRVRREAAVALLRMGCRLERVIPKILGYARDRNWPGRAVMVGSLGYHARRPDVSAVLAAAVKDPDPKIRLAGVRALTGFHLPAREHVAPLAGALTDSDVQVRKRALVGLGWIGRRAAPAAGAIEKLTNDPETSLAIAAWGAFGRVKPKEAPRAVAALRIHLRSPDAVIRQQAADALKGLDPAASRALPELLSTLEMPGAKDQRARWARDSAIQALGRIAAYDSEAFDTIVKALKHRDPLMRSRAAWALSGLQRETGRTVPALTKVLSDKDSTVANGAAWSLGSMGRSASSAVPRLKAVASQHAGYPRVTAIAALSRIAPRSVPDPSTLTAAITEGYPSQRRQVLQAVARMGPSAAGARQALRTALRDKRGEIRCLAAVALWKVCGSSEECIAELSATLGSRSSRARAKAADALGEIGNGAAATVPQLLEALADPEPRVRGAAAVALGRIGADAGRAVPAIAALLRKRATRIKAAEALGHFGPSAASALPAIRALLEKAPAGSRVTFAAAIWRIDPATRTEMQKLLLQGLADDSYINQLRTVRAVSNLGVLAVEVVPALERLRRSPHGYVRWPVAQALEKIQRTEQKQ
jgi:HEAT repeat protein